MDLSGAQGDRPVGRTFVSSEVLLAALKSSADGQVPDITVTEGYHHLTRVLRCRPGQTLELFDGAGLVAKGKIRSIDSDHLVVRLKAAWSVKEPEPTTTLVCALLKAPAMDSVVRKVTELGISRLVVCATERSVPTRHGKAGEKRLERWKRIAAEACLQCGRPIPTVIRFFPSWVQGLDAVADLSQSRRGQTIKALLHPGFESTMGRVLESARKSAALVMAVGPEGGFTDPELRAALSTGWLGVGLGPLVLRAETAAVVASAFIGHAVGRFDGTGGWEQDDERIVEKVW